MQTARRHALGARRGRALSRLRPGRRTRRGGPQPGAPPPPPATLRGLAGLHASRRSQWSETMKSADTQA